MRRLLLVLVLLQSAGCSTSATTPAPASSGAAAVVAVAVPWKDYAPDVKARIDESGLKKDCKALQTEFNVADANNEATRKRVGHNNAALMSYIDETMRKAGCYK